MVRRPDEARVAIGLKLGVSWQQPQAEGSKGKDEDTGKGEE